MPVLSTNPNMAIIDYKSLTAAHFDKYFKEKCLSVFNPLVLAAAKTCLTVKVKAELGKYLKQK